MTWHCFLNCWAKSWRLQKYHDLTEFQVQGLSPVYWCYLSMQPHQELFSWTWQIEKTQPMAYGLVNRPRSRPSIETERLKQSWHFCKKIPSRTETLLRFSGYSAKNWNIQNVLRWRQWSWPPSWKSSPLALWKSRPAGQTTSEWHRNLSDGHFRMRLVQFCAHYSILVLVRICPKRPTYFR